jgi:hypothetical protein
MSLTGYFLYGIDDEMLMVIRGQDEEAMLSIITKLKKSRDSAVKQLAETLESHFYDTDSDGRSSGKTRPQDKKNGGVSVRGRNTKAKNAKPVT